MKENKMGNRGSKSVFNNTVKEQRADDNWYISKIYLRCALMGFERSYQVRFHSKRLYINTVIFSLSSHSPLKKMF